MFRNLLHIRDYGVLIGSGIIGKICNSRMQITGPGERINKLNKQCIEGILRCNCCTYCKYALYVLYRCNE